MTDAAKALLDRGISVVPVGQPDRPKAPCIPQWKDLQEKPITIEEFSRHKPTSVGIICGKVSGNLEALDFDDADLFRDWADRYKLVGDGRRLRIHRTPSGGYHVLYRVDGTVPGNMILVRGTNHNGVESRGEGGYVVAPPSPGYSLIRDSDLEPLSWHERCALVQCLIQPPGKESASGIRAWEDEHDWETLLAEAGWVEEKNVGENTYYTRPGKKGGVSASLNGDCLYVFTSSIPGLEPNRAYGKFGFFAAIYHNGSIAKAAQSLSIQAKTGPLQIVSATAFSGKPMEFLWEPYIPLGYCTMITGTGGTGKTTFAMEVGRHIYEGRVPYGSTQHPGRSLIISNEDSPDDLVSVLMANNAPLEAFDFMPSKEFSLTREGMDKLHDIIKQAKYKWVVFDSIMYYFSGDVNNQQDTRKVMAGLTAIAMQEQMSFGLVRHVSKAVVGRKANEAGQGSMQFHNSARSELLLTREQEDDGQDFTKIRMLRGNIRTQAGPPLRYYRVGDRVIWP